MVDHTVTDYQLLGADTSTHLPEVSGLLHMYISTRNMVAEGQDHMENEDFSS